MRTSFRPPLHLARKTGRSIAHTGLLCLLAALACHPGRAAEVPPPSLGPLVITNGQKRLTWVPYAGATQYRILRAEALGQPFVEDTSGSIAGFDWSSPTLTPGFHVLEAVPMPPAEVLTANVLNRLAYGPTPEELDRVRSMGPDAYIQEQLAPETLSENLDIDRYESVGGWRFVSVTGTATSRILYVYLTTATEGWIDDLRLVSGTNAAVGANLIRNGDFEAPLTTNDWVISTNLTASGLDPSFKYSGNSSLHLVATSAGSSQSSSLWQTNLAVTLNQTYTLSYWYYAPSNRNSSLTLRLSGSGISSTPDSTIPLMTRLQDRRAAIDDLRAWHVLHGIQSRKQLQEVLLQFLENHFVTQYDKSQDYFDGFYDSDTNPGDDGRAATNLEFREIQRWRQALLNPQCTFLDLLRISAESPAMIIYLDTVTSRGDGTYVANENYARELLELFTFGVDNGYDQNDIVQTSKAWTGWRVRYSDPANEFNPFGLWAGGVTNITSITNQPGLWAFNYRQDRHNNTAKTIFPGKTVPARFGAPWAGRNYELLLAARSGTNSIQDGYQVLNHLANQPFTSEYISVKLCRLFIHDNFPNPTTRAELPEYAYYDYSRLAELTPEARLVHACMMAWENGNPKGQIRDVLRVIFASELFRTQQSTLQKVKTPLEFTVSVVRALRLPNPAGGYTADTDGFSLRSPMGRMGSMSLFNRAEPDGYPEAAAPWISAGTLAERLRFLQSFCLATSQRGTATDAGNSSCNPVALLQLRLPSTSWSNADAVADLFLQLLYPGEGAANLSAYRQIAVNFLNDGSADTSTTTRLTPFSGLPVSSAAGSSYDTRVRGMVSALMTSPRFHEQ